MSDLPAISVIMTSYNRGGYLFSSVSALLNSNYENYELIFVDDGSTDNTSEVIKSFSSSKIKYIFCEHKNRWSAFNTGIRNSSGKYILPLDSDDLIEGDYLSILIKYANKFPQMDYFYPEKLRIIDKNNKKKGVWNYNDYSSNQKILPYLFFVSGHSLIPFGGSLFKKEIYEKYGFHAEKENVQDFSFLSLNLLKIKFFWVKNLEGYSYRIHSENISGNLAERSKNIADALYSMIMEYSPEQLCPKLENIIEKEEKMAWYYFFLKRVFEKLEVKYQKIGGEGKYFRKYSEIFTEKWKNYLK